MLIHVAKLASKRLHQILVLAAQRSWALAWGSGAGKLWDWGFISSVFLGVKGSISYVYRPSALGSL